ncbi:hypothetical protein DPMN_022652 [Dreissena polymorpha]|uniref:B box-type domain-containing protein n=3 Tax=Dreissena polymorpha TaxID=45954 RepID=A0A9D4NQR6_DREPO|nr:hypothetical protein DPMN_022652 [Dreissena polymorpha]
MATNGEEPDQEISSDMIGECIVIKSCEPCTRKHTLSNATVFCKTCNEHLCDPCKNIHIIYKSGTHDTVAVEDLDMASVVVTMKGMDTCRDHDKKIKFFCEDHSKLCCNKCAFIHRKCDNVNELASLSSQEGLELQELNKTLLKLTTENFSIKTETEKALNETTANLPKQVDDMKDRIIDILDKSQKKIMVDADTFRAEEMKRIGERTEAFSRINTNINELIPFTSAVVKLGTPQQKYIATKVINETIKDMQTHITEHRSKHITSNVSVDFSKQLLFLLKGEESIVKLKVKRHFTHTDVVQSSTTNMQESSEVSNETTVLNKDVVQSSPTHVQESSEISNETTVLNKDAVQSSPTNIQESSEVSKETTVINKDVEQSSRTNTDLNQESSEVTKKTTVINKGNSNDDAQSARIKPVTMELLVSVELKQTGVDTEPFLSGIDFLPDGRLVAVDNKNRKCIIMNDMLQIQGTPYALQYISL